MNQSKRLTILLLTALGVSSCLFIFGKTDIPFTKRKKDIIAEIPIYHSYINYDYANEVFKVIKKNNTGHPLLNQGAQPPLAITIPVGLVRAGHISQTDLLKYIYQELDLKKENTEHIYQIWVKVATIIDITSGWWTRDTNISLDFAQPQIQVNRMQLIGADEDAPLRSTQLKRYISDIFYMRLNNVPKKLRNKIPLELLEDNVDRNYTVGQPFSPIFIIVRREQMKKPEGYLRQFLRKIYK